MERVSVIRGTKRILLVCPHGYDDDFTDVLTETAADFADAHAVINRGWERADVVDQDNDKANCNSIAHCKEDVVREEFLEPIQKIVRKQTQTDASPFYIFHIHGMGDHWRKKIHPNLDIMLGHGAGGGGKDRFTATDWQKNMIYHLLRTHWTVVEAGGGSPFAGWSLDNMNQLFRRSMTLPGLLGICSVQLEFVLSLRKTKSDAEAVGKKLGIAISNICGVLSWNDPVGSPPHLIHGITKP